MTKAAGVGAIVLAAYDPPEELFRRQLQSLQAQSVSEWQCIISVDGPREPVEAAVRRAVPGDERFIVIGDGTRRGFYLNFEHGLKAVDPATSWIALADQDDRWDDDKLARLLPHLESSSLVSGQARLLAYPSDTVTGRTDRADHGWESTLMSNQFTGSLCVFERSLLETALPFPRVATRVATHDHWIAVVAGAARGTQIVDELVQDYVQHDKNVFGDPSRIAPGGIMASIRNVLGLAKRFEGSSSPAAIARMTFWTYVGWRQLMTDTLAMRIQDSQASRRDELFGVGRSRQKLMRLLSESVDRGIVPARFAAEYRASWNAGTLIRGRRLASLRAHPSSDA